MSEFTPPEAGQLSDGRRCTNPSPGAATTVRLPASRAQGATRAVLWSTGALILGAAAWLVARQVNLASSGLTNRLVDWSLLLVGVPFAAGSVGLGIQALRWGLLSAWPGFIGFEASGVGIIARLGPFGSWSFKAHELRIRYPFEQVEDGEEGDFEAFLPEERQRSELLPRISAQGGRVQLNKVILKFVGLSERQTAFSLRGAIDHWRQKDSTPPAQAGFGPVSET